jgi:hypothetical protein
MIRICPKRDAKCPHGMDCPYAVDRYTCAPEPEGRMSANVFQESANIMKAELAEAAIERLTREKEEGWDYEAFERRVLAEHGTTIKILAARLDENAAALAKAQQERDEARELAQMFSQADRKPDWIVRADSLSAQLTKAREALESIAGARMLVGTDWAGLVDTLQSIARAALAPAKTELVIDTRISDETRAALAEIDEAQRAAAKQASSIIIGAPAKTEGE